MIVLINEYIFVVDIIRSWKIGSYELGKSTQRKE